MPVHVVLLLAAIGFFSALAQGLSGFGFALLAVPLFSFFLPLQTVVPITTMLGVGVNLVLVRETKNIRPRLRELVLMLAFSVLAIPAGVWCLKYLETAWLKVFIGSVALVCTFFLYRGLCLPVNRPILWGGIVGAVCGFLNGLANLAGPVLILYLNNLKLEKKVFRAFTILMFSTMGIVTFATAIASGLVNRSVLIGVAVLLPFIFLGSWVGGRLAKRVDEALFRKLSLVVLAATSLSIIVSGLTSL